MSCKVVLFLAGHFVILLRHSFPNILLIFVMVLDISVCIIRVLRNGMLVRGNHLARLTEAFEC